MNPNSANSGQGKNSFNFKAMKSMFASGLNQATQKSKELANKVKESEIMKKATESTKKGAESFKKGATNLWNETKVRGTNLTHNLQKNMQRPHAAQPAQPDVFDTFNDPSVVANQYQTAPVPAPAPALAPVPVPAPAPVAEEPEEDLFDVSAPAIVTEQAPAEEPAAEEPEEDLFDMSAPAVVTEQAPAEPVSAEANELNDVFAAAAASTEANELNDVFAAAAASTEANELNDVFAAAAASTEANELNDVFSSPAVSAEANDLNDVFSSPVAPAVPTNDLNDVFSSPAAMNTNMDDAFAAPSMEMANEPAANAEEDVFGEMDQPTIEKGGISKFDDAFAGLSEENANSTPLPSMGMFDMDMTAPVHYEEPKKLSFAELQALNAKAVSKKEEESLDDMGFDMGFGSTSNTSPAQPSLTNGSENLDFMF